MPGLPGPEIAQHAVELSRQSPGRPAIEVLDIAMRIFEGAGRLDADRGTVASASVHIDPPSPFAELLRRAFAPGMDPRELALIGLKGTSDAPDLQAVIEQAADRWQGVVALFAERYRQPQARG